MNASVSVRKVERLNVGGRSYTIETTGSFVCLLEAITPVVDELQKREFTITSVNSSMHVYED